MSRGSKRRFSTRIPFSRSGMVVSTLTRTTEPNRRRRTPSSIVSSRSSASSSWICISASRVILKGWAVMISMPGKSVSR